MADTIDQPDEMLLTLTSDIVAAHVGNNSVAVADMPELIKSVYASLTGLGAEQPPAEEELVPAVSIRSSVKPDYIVCLEDGKKLKMLTRHLPEPVQSHARSVSGALETAGRLSDDRAGHSERRRELAKSIGLGRKRAKAEVAVPAAPAAARAPRRSAKSPT
jgi:predicted transcriptional regulator